MLRLIVWVIAAAGLFGCDAPKPPAPSTVTQQPVEQVSSVTLAVIAWNVESGGSDPAVIAKQLSELGGYDIYCLSEVDPKTFDQNVTALGSKFTTINGNTGRDDRLQIIFNKERFELLEQKELMEYREFILNNGTHRSPLYARLKDKTTGLQFIVMNNHLARGNADLRTKQAIGLREWARDQSTGVINVGDFNMDFDFRTERGNEAFPEIIRDNIFTWVRPVELIDTNWADNDGDGKDNYPDSMLDFAFVSGPAKDWKPVCKVIVRDGDFPDDKTTSDHRPIELKMTISGR